MRIAYLVSQYPAFNHTFVLREIRQLRAAGIDVDVFSVRAPDRPPAAMTDVEREELARTRAVIPVGPLGALAAHTAVLVRRPRAWVRGLALALRLGRGAPGATVDALAYFAEAVVAGHWMTRAGLEHVHVHFSSTVGLLLSTIFPVSMSMTIHGPAEFDDVVGTWLGRKVEASRFVVAISHFGRSQILRVCPPELWERVEVVPLGVDLAEFRPTPRRAAGEPFELLMVGRLAPVKAQHVLIDAVEQLRARGRRVRLRLVGDGPDRGSLERAIAERGLAGEVQLLGAQNQTTVRALYHETDAFVLASFAEGVPVVLMEAMATEVPCVATRIMGIPELIRDGVDGLLVTPADAGEIVSAVERLMDDRELAGRLARSGRQRVAERYDLATNDRRLAALLERRLGGRAAVTMPDEPAPREAREPVGA